MGDAKGRLERSDLGLQPAPTSLWNNKVKGDIEGQSTGPDCNLNMGGNL